MRNLLRRLHGTAVMAFHMVDQRRVCHAPSEQLRAVCDGRLRRIVRHAADSVPYYQQLFRTQAIDPEDIWSVEDLDRLPLIDKYAVRQQPELFLSTSRFGRTAIPLTSSGSTGVPLRVYWDRGAYLQSLAYRMREREVIANILGRSLGYSEIAVTYPESAGDRAAKWEQDNTFMPQGAHHMRLSLLDPTESIVAAINAHRPDVLKGYGSYLEALFRTVSARSIPMHAPKVVVYFSDGMSEGGRRLVRERFGARVIARYSAVEACRLGFTCEEGKVYHLHADLTHVRIIDAHGRRLPCGEEGEIVISNLVNRGMVLLNYRLEDTGSLSSKPCPCGRTLPLLTNLTGRSHDTLELMDGQFVPPARIWRVFKARFDALDNRVIQYQLVQHSREHFELRLATLGRETFAQVVPELLAELSLVLGKPASIEATYYPDRLPVPAGGKVRTIMSLLTPEGD